MPLAELCVACWMQRVVQSIVVAIPVDAPAYPAPPYHYRGAQAIALSWSRRFWCWESRVFTGQGKRQKHRVAANCKKD